MNQAAAAKIYYSNAFLQHLDFENIFVMAASFC